MTNFDYGTIEHNGVTIRLLQEAYVDSHGQDERPFYRATGCGSDGQDYMIQWEMRNGLWEHDEDYDADYAEQVGGDESMACDWESPSVVRALGDCDHN